MLARLGNLIKTAAAHIVNIAVDWNGVRHERVVAQPDNVINDASFEIRKGVPFDISTIDRSGTLSMIMPAALVESGRFEALFQKSGHDIVAEQLHAAVRVVDHEPFPRA